MGLETASYVGGLVASNPTATDAKSQGDDHLRLLKSVLLNTFAGFPGLVVVTGSETQGATANDYVLTVSPAPAAYTSGFFAVFKATHTNTGAVTLAINALSAKTLKAVDGSALESGDIESGGAVVVFYDGTDFFLISGNDRAARAGDTYTGTHDMTGAVLNVATQTQGDNSTKASSTAYVDAALDAKADIDSPAFTGTPTAPTPSLTDNSTKLATTAFVVQLAFQAALPAQSGNGGKFLKTDGTNSSWVTVPPPSVIRSARAANAILEAADNATLIDITSGTFTQTFTAAATLGSGWYCWIRNSGTGDITLDPNGAETIDGLTSYIMYPGECRLVQCDGVGFNSIVLSAFYRTFTSSGTFTKPPGYSNFSGLLWGGGASGTGNNTSGGGGGGGACAPFTLHPSSFGTTETVTIGAGGVASAGSGNAGGNSTLGVLVSAYGGGAPSIYPAGGGGIYSAGSANYGGLPAVHGVFNDNLGTGFHSIPGAYGGGAPRSSGASNAQGPNTVYGGGAGAPVDGVGYSHHSIWGGAGGGTINSSAAQAAGTSKYGGNGGAASTVGAGTAGTAPGGGGGASLNSTSGAGARGELRMWGVI